MRKSGPVRRLVAEEHSAQGKAESDRSNFVQTATASSRFNIHAAVRKLEDSE